MDIRLLHVFRNTPFGRETLLQSAYFCRMMEISMGIYTPKDKKFLLYFEHEAVQVDLDSSYLASPETAQEHIQDILDEMGVHAEHVVPTQYTASNLPDVPPDYAFMCCPRIISDLSTKIALGKIGSRVRRIMRSAPFPILIPSPVFKPWKRIVVLFGGSVNAAKSLHLGIRISRNSGLPLTVVTMAKEGERPNYEKALEEHGLTRAVNKFCDEWKVIEGGDFAENLYAVPHDALVVLGAYGHGLIKDIMFGSRMELVQSTLPNNLLIAGPRFTLHPWYKTDTGSMAE